MTKGLDSVKLLKIDFRVINPLPIDIGAMAICCWPLIKRRIAFCKNDNDLFYKMTA